MTVGAKYQGPIFKAFYRIARHGAEDGFGLDLTVVSRPSQVSGLVVNMRFNPGLGSVFCIEGRVVFPAMAGTGLATKDLAF